MCIRDRVTRTVNVVPAPDTTAPVITLIGPSILTHEAGTSYTDAGATASDNIDGDITNSLTVSNLVDTNTIGAYSVTYNVSDSAGNAASPFTRIVNVVDTTAPVITLVGDTDITIYSGNPYTDAGATASDNIDGDISSSISVTNPVDPNTVGTYTITYNVSDSAATVSYTHLTLPTTPYV